MGAVDNSHYSLVIAAAQAAGPCPPGDEAAWGRRVHGLTVDLHLIAQQARQDIERLESAHAPTDVVVLVSHGWFGNVLLARLLGIAELDGVFELANTALTLVEDESDEVPWRRTAVRVNWMPHLGPDLITDSVLSVG